LIAGLRAVSVAGIFHSLTDEESNLGRAMTNVSAKGGYWSPRVQQILACPDEAQLRLRCLTPTERLLICVLGDGRMTKKEAGCWG